MGAAAKSKIDPFKVKKKPAPSKSKTEVVEAPQEIKDAVDRFRECQEQAKHFEGEATLHKEKVTQFAREQFAKRYSNGQKKNFKILGNEATATYIAMDKSSFLNQEEVDQLGTTYGDKFVEELIESHFGLVKFNPEVLEANYEKIVAALQAALPNEVLENLFLPVPMKACKGALAKAAEFARDEQDLEQIMGDLKITNYIR